MGEHHRNCSCYSCSNTVREQWNDIQVKEFNKEIEMARTKNVNRINAPIGITVMLNKRVTRLMYDLQIEEPNLGDNHDEFMSNLRQATAYIKKAQELATENKV